MSAICLTISSDYKPELATKLRVKLQWKLWSVAGLGEQLEETWRDLIFAEVLINRNGV